MANGNVNTPGPKAGSDSAVTPRKRMGEGGSLPKSKQAVHIPGQARQTTGKTNIPGQLGRK